MAGPETIVKAPAGGFPVAHEWNPALAEKFYLWEEEDIRLIELIQRIGYKGQMALGVALVEWLLWRFEGMADLTLGHRAVEASWATVIHVAYSKPLGFEPKNVPPLSPLPEVDGPLRIGLSVLREMRGRYLKGKPQLAASVMKLALLDRHVIPARAEFERWLSATLERVAKAMPAGPEPESGTYDPAAGTPVTREFFFDPSFDLKKETNRAALSSFLAALEPGSHPFLRTPEELQKEGFTGEPYRFP